MVSLPFSAVVYTGKQAAPSTISVVGESTSIKAFGRCTSLANAIS
jgi:hypothetical protein